MGKSTLWERPLERVTRICAQYSRRSAFFDHCSLLWKGLVFQVAILEIGRESKSVGKTRRVIQVMVRDVSQPELSNNQLRSMRQCCFSFRFAHRRRIHRHQ